MGEDFYTLPGLREVSDSSELKLERTLNLLSAIRRNRDYSIIQLLKRDDRMVECIIVDVETDGVPPRNPHGIRYRERLALCVSDNPNELVAVLALRKDFPILMHQNQTPTESPRSLCLYFETPASVLRTWTPERFLRRIQWWLEKSATGDLHPADQPVEQLFFPSKYELVLPCDFEKLRTREDRRLIIVRGPERPDGGMTCFLESIQKDGQPPNGTVQFIECTLPPIVHGHIESNPSTLGELATLLQRRGIDFLHVLQEKVRLNVGEKGEPESADDMLSIIVLHVPVTRAEDSKFERVTHRAFMVKLGAFKLGLMTGALFIQEVSEGKRTVRKYFNAMGILGAEPATVWRDELILPMEVLHRNDTASARKQSGIVDGGPVGVMVGAGSLGSALLNLFGRSGWGQWTAIDKDHIKPHNVSRHTAYAEHIGQLKVNVVAHLHAAAMEGASQIAPLHADARDMSHPAVIGALKGAALVVDASTTLEYPRAVSDVEGVGRHISVFIAPNGNAAVLLAEDDRRRIRLRSLEAQYYRAVIREDWGEHHLDGNLGSFWSGASCRDITAIIPYSRILGHASALAEQIPMFAASPDAIIRVWQRDPHLGSVVVHDIAVSEEISGSFGSFKLLLDAGVLKQLREWRAASLPGETGGVLLGYYDFNVSTVTVVAALPAPPDSVSSPIGFERGVAGLPERVREAARRTAEIVGYIGEWHSHPRGHSALPSSHDLVQLLRLSRGMAEDGLPAVQLIVGEKEFQVLQMTNAT